MYLPGKILKMGSSADIENASQPSLGTAYVLDMTVASPAWVQVGSMSFIRSFHSATLLPDGNVLVTGGGADTAPADLANAVLPAEVWSPATGTWTTLAAMHAPRLYHSGALLLPDARVLILGGGRFGEREAEDFRRRDTAEQEPDHAPRQHVRLARARIGGDPGGRGRIGRLPLHPQYVLRDLQKNLAHEPFASPAATSDHSLTRARWS